MAPVTERQQHLLHVFSTFAVGGPQRRFVQLANSLGAKYRHSILAMDGDFAAAKGLDRGVACVLETIPVHKGATISVANLFNARRLLRSIAPDVLLTYNWGTIEWAIANRLPTVCRHVHLEDGFGPDESPERQLWRRAKARRLLLSRCDRVIVPSRVLHDLATRVWRLSPDKVDYLPNGIDCSRFAAPFDSAFAVELGIDDNALVVGTVAALRREKNLMRLVRLFASLSHDIEAQLVIIGDGPERPAIAQAAQDLGVAARVVFTGALDRPERLLGRFDVFALTSDTEQMPYSVLEAMAAGLPLAATDVGDVKCMVAPENAEFVVPVSDEESLRRRLLQLLRDPLLRARLGRANQQSAHGGYALDRMVERYDDLFAGRE
jgi:L-malate glycosyltransferase